MGAFYFSGTWPRAKARGSWPFREDPTSSTYLDPSPLPSDTPTAIRWFNRRADEKAHGVVRCPRAVPHGKIGGTMARTAECAAPEGSQDRDEWMTVIEMQEYMGRAEARRTTSSGRERSTRTGSEGSSWCRGRQWTPTSSRGAGGNDGGDRPGSRPRPGTRGSLETKGARGRP